MNKKYPPIIQFNHLSHLIHQAIKKKNFDEANKIATKQNNLADDLLCLSKVNFEKEQYGEWEKALLFCQTLRKSLATEMKKLNSHTRNKLRILKGYSR